jgi:hypothetical protein
LRPGATKQWPSLSKSKEFRALIAANLRQSLVDRYQAFHDLLDRLKFRTMQDIDQAQGREAAITSRSIHCRISFGTLRISSVVGS